jgi:predicted amidohydrolase
MLKVALIPFKPKLGKVSDNIESMASHVLDFARPKPNVILFPELASSGYLMESLTFECSLTKDDPLWSPLWEASLQTGAEIILGACLKTETGIKNSALVIRNGETLFEYEKIYLPTYGMFDEARYFTPGTRLGVYDGFLGKTGILICEDVWHGVLPYSLFAAGVSAVVILSASPARGFCADSNQSASALRWERMLSTYSGSYGYQVLYVNRSGAEDGVAFAPKATYAMNGEIHNNHINDEPVIFDVHHAVDRFSTYGNPAQNENWALNEKLLKQAHSVRFPESL